MTSAPEVQSVSRALGLLEHVADAESPIGLSELAGAAGLPLSTVHRITRSLVAAGYLHQEPDRRYRLGLRLAALGGVAFRPVGPELTAWLGELVAATGETANAATLAGDAVVFVAQAQSPHAMRSFRDVGRRTMPHCSAAGKALLSLLPDAQVEAVALRTGTPAMTCRTIASAAGLLAAVREIRSTGFAVDDEEEEYGARCVAVPVPAAPFPLAVSLSGPTTRVTPERLPGLVGELRRVVGLRV